MRVYLHTALSGEGHAINANVCRDDLVPGAPFFVALPQGRVSRSGKPIHRKGRIDDAAEPLARMHGNEIRSVLGVPAGERFE